MKIFKKIIKYLQTAYRELTSRINYKEEFDKRKCDIKLLKKITKIKKLYELKLLTFIVVIFILSQLFNLIFKIEVLAPFLDAKLNLQFMSLLFGIFATILLYSDVFSFSKYQLALESSTLFGSNDILLDSEIKHKVVSKYGLIFLSISLLIQIIYTIL